MCVWLYTFISLYTKKFPYSIGSQIITMSAVKSFKWVATRLVCNVRTGSQRFYHENVIDHYENPRNVGSLDKKKKNVGTGIINFKLYNITLHLTIPTQSCGQEWLRSLISVYDTSMVVNSITFRREIWFRYLRLMYLWTIIIKWNLKTMNFQALWAHLPVEMSWSCRSK